jgi:hypothetical protein
MMDQSLPQPLVRKIATVLIVTALLLAIPFCAMRFTGEVNWTLLDFVVAGVLISGTGFAYVAITHKLKSRGQRLAVGLALGFLFCVVWVELAVGIFD